MKRIAKYAAVSLAACLLAFAVGCSSNASSSAEVSHAEGNDATSTEAPDLDPANLANGEYQVDVELEGGTGRAYIESPARVVVDGGQAKLVVVWSSENYDLMVVDGEEYLPVPRAGNSTFEVPVSTVSGDLPIQAETTAMSEPHLIDYVIHFDTSTLAPAA